MDAHAAGDRRSWWALRIGAAGVVYGDIGTSPLYTWGELHRTGTLVTEGDVLGATSLVFWTLTLAITVKYVQLVLRADNDGEGGTFALMGLIQRHPVAQRAALLTLLTFAACLLYADGLITPAISVLSAVEGLTVVHPGLAPFVLPLSVGILCAVFASQYLGSSRLGMVFGTVILVWFACIATLGVRQIAERPDIALALLPHHAVRFLCTHDVWSSAAVLGAAVLAITGGEALYADLGHFGARAIRQVWNFAVYPALVLNYLGQGAYLLGGGEVRGDTVFFSIVPDALMLPAVALATMATVIASQALISGAFSLTRSAINLGLLPRMMVVHTSEQVEGQIYLPAVNWALCVGCCLLVLTFGTSSDLASAYGLAVMGVVTTTTLSLAFLSRAAWGWPLAVTVVVFGGFLVFDGTFLAANLLKILEGAWVSVLLASGLYLVMRIWKTGRESLADAYRRVPTLPMRTLVERRDELGRMPRAMVFLVSEPVRTADAPAPVLLLKFVDRYGALPKHLTLFTILFDSTSPRYSGERFEVTPLGGNVVSVRMHVGYAEHPDLREALHTLKQRQAVRIHASRWTIVVGREEILVQRGSMLWRARYLAFAAMLRWSARAHRAFGLSYDTGVSKELIAVRVFEDTGMQIALDLSELHPRDE